MQLNSICKSNQLIALVLTIITSSSASSPAFATSQDVDEADIARVLTLKLDRVGGDKKALASYKQEFVVICFTSNTCPYSIDYEGRLKDLQNNFRKMGWSAVVVAVNSNDHKDDSLEEMGGRAKQQEFNFDYLKDETQEVAKGFDAVYTPEFFVLNKQRKVVYQGALDDATKRQDVTVNYVVKAIEAIRSGKTPEVKKTGARGCRIRFQRRRRK